LKIIKQKKNAWNFKSPLRGLKAIISANNAEINQSILRTLCGECIKMWRLIATVSIIKGVYGYNLRCAMQLQDLIEKGDPGKRRRWQKEYEL
jgi:hypothetical protein